MLLMMLMLACNLGEPPPVPTPIPADAVPIEGTVLDAEDGSTVLLHGHLAAIVEAGAHRFAMEQPPPPVGWQLTGMAWRGEDGLHLHAGQAVRVPTGPKGFQPGGHPIKGKVVRVDDAGVVLDHETIPGVMMAMVMPFEVVDPKLLDGLKAGDQVEGRLLVADWDYYLAELNVTASGDMALRTDIKPMKVLELLPTVSVPTHAKETWTVGEGQGAPTALSFIYTRCPDPDFCPAVVTRLQALQDKIKGKARIVAVTLDPSHDTVDVLGDYAALVGADPETWRFARVDEENLQQLALRSALTVTEEEGRIVHQIRLLVLDKDGRLLERYHDNGWDLDRVVSQLTVGAPTAHPASQGTLSE
jgi:protein SCO1/2